MGLFVILRHLVSPIINLAERQGQISAQQRKAKNIERIPAHLRQDIFSDDRYWRRD